ncbi:hypothetical protein D3C80_614630 [compost metagenome]
MPLQIIARIDGQGRIVDRRTIRDHHQDLALFRPVDQPVMRPHQRFAVDVFLEQALAHHQAEIAARTAPRSIRRLVDDMAQVVEAAGRSRLAAGKPVLAALTTLPRLRREAEDLDLDAAALQRTRQNIGAGRRHCDRPPTHRAGIVDHQSDNSIAELRVALLLEGKRLHRVDDQAHKTGRIEIALFQIEIPRAVLLRHQAALQSVCQATDRTLKMR